MILAQFFRGPYDGERLVLPCEREEPWKRFVIPKFDTTPIVIEFFYLYSGWQDEIALYLFDEEFSPVIDT